MVDAALIGPFKGEEPVGREARVAAARERRARNVEVFPTPAKPPAVPSADIAPPTALRPVALFAVGIGAGVAAGLLAVTLLRPAPPAATATIAPPDAATAPLPAPAAASTPGSIARPLVWPPRAYAMTALPALAIPPATADPGLPAAAHRRAAVAPPAIPAAMNSSAVAL